MLGASSVSSEERPLAGGWTVTEAAAELHKAGGSIAPTLQMGTLRLSGCCDLAMSQTQKRQSQEIQASSAHTCLLWGLSPQAAGMA